MAKPMNTRLWVTVFLLVSVLLGTSCGRTDTPPPGAAEVLAAMQATMEEGPSAPEGRIYARAADPAARDYLGETLLSALYGEAARGLLLPGEDGTAPAVGDVAIFLSTAPHPAELAVFRCSDARGTATAAKLCRARLELVRRAHTGGEWTALVERATVSVEGSYVFLVVAEDPDSVLNAARRLCA